MKISLNWINDYVDIGDIDPKWLIDRITVTTAEVEEIIYMDNNTGNVAVADQPNEDIFPIKDTIFVIDNKSLTNRPDLWCHYGMAREIAAITGRKLKAIDSFDEAYLKNISGKELNVSIEATAKVLRYSSIAVTNINRTKSPLIISTRLHYCGIKSINFIVDLSNYVMLDIGLPLHTFDRSLMKSIHVSASKEDESFTTLDDVNRKLPPDTLMIGNKEQYTAIAGIMGGKDSEIKTTTTDILLESADFDGAAIRKTSSALGLRTDASIRYEKFLDSTLTLTAIGRFLRLLLKYDDRAQISSSVYDKVINETTPIEITVKHSYIETYLGNKITSDEVLKILTAIEFEAVKTDDAYKIKVPTFRATKDVTEKVDIVEEILRFYGYDRIKSCPFSMDIKPMIQNSIKDTEARVKDVLAMDFSFNEVHSYSWYDSQWLKRINYKTEDNLKIVNSHITQYSILRDSLMPNLLQIAYENRKDYGSFKLFEVGRPYIRKEDSCNQPKHLSILIYKNSEEEIEKLFFYLKGICNTIFRSIKNISAEYKLSKKALSIISEGMQLDIFYKDLFIGYIGVVNNEISKLFGDKNGIVVMDIDLQTFDSINKTDVIYEPVLKYPDTYLDFSFLVNNTMTYETFSSLMYGYRNNHILSIEYVDCYEGKNVPAEMKSITVRLKIGDKNKTLEFKEIETVQSEFINYMDRNGLKIR